MKLTVGSYLQSSQLDGRDLLNLPLMRLLEDECQFGPHYHESGM